MVACPEFKVTWQVRGKPDCKVCGQVRAVGLRPKSDSVTWADEAPIFAVKTAASSWSIKELVTVNGTVVVPATALITGGTLTCVLLDESLIVGLFSVAAPVRMIWQALVPPPIRVSGLQTIVLTATFELDGPRSVRVSDTDWLGALITTEVVDDTAPAVAVKVALLKPVPMVMLFGIVTVWLDDVKGIGVIDCATVPRLNVHTLEPGV